MKKIMIVIVTMIFVTMSSIVWAEEHTENPDSIQIWEGNYTRNEQFNYADLEIVPSIDNNFKFTIRASSGGHNGKISGIASVINNQAKFDNGRGGVLTFNRKNDGGIVITQSNEMSEYGGIGVSFNGIYRKKSEQKTAVVNETYFTERQVFRGNQEVEFKRLVGENYIKFANTAQLVSSEKDLDNTNSRVYRMNVRGLFTIMESIIMVRDSDNSIWAAVIDQGKVLYFTNTADTKYIPITISRWHDRLKDKPIYYIFPSK